MFVIHSCVILMKSEKQQTRPPASTEPQLENITFLNLGSCKKMKMANSAAYSTATNYGTVQCSSNKQWLTAILNTCNRGLHEGDLEGGLLYWGPRKIC